MWRARLYLNGGTPRVYLLQERNTKVQDQTAGVLDRICVLDEKLTKTKKRSKHFKKRSLNTVVQKGR